MHRHTKLAIGAAAALVAAAGAGAGVAAASGTGDDDATERPITGDALESATTAALAHTGGGEVTGTETGDEDSKYEVEVTLEDGSQVDVQLDERFNVVSSEGDDDNSPDD